MTEPRLPMSALKSLLLTDLSDNPKLLSLAETSEGKILLLSLFGIVLEIGNPGLNMPAFGVVFLTVVACTFYDKHRMSILPTAVLLLLAADPFPYWFTNDVLKLAISRELPAENTVNVAHMRYETLAVFFVLYVALLHGALRFRDLFIYRRPLVFLLSTFFALLFFVSAKILHGLAQVYLWSFVSVFGTYLWFMAYALTDLQTKDHSPLRLQFGLLHPFWGSSSVPHGKGAAYIRKVMSRTPQELALSQVKGMKLLLICLFFRGVKFVFDQLMHGYFHVPQFVDAIKAQVNGTPFSGSLCWASLISAYFEWVFFISIIGNTFVGCARMSGFYLLRNTYKPIRATSIAEFFNRFFYYFKELLVDMFFFSTFVRYFRKQKRLRIAFATFMAAGIGNMLYHFVRDLDWIVGMGFWKALIGYQTYAFYCVVLAAGIISSQLWPYKPRSTTWFGAKFVPCFGVFVFYCFLHIFDDTDRMRTLGQHFDFLFHLFGLT